MENEYVVFNCATDQLGEFFKAENDGQARAVAPSDDVLAEMCYECEGTGYAFVIDGEEIDCPECDGTGDIYCEEYVLLKVIEG